MKLHLSCNISFAATLHIRLKLDLRWTLQKQHRPHTWAGKHGLAIPWKILATARPVKLVSRYIHTRLRISAFTCSSFINTSCKRTVLSPFFDLLVHPSLTSWTYASTHDDTAIRTPFSLLQQTVCKAVKQAHLHSLCREFRFTDFCLTDSFNWTDYICKARNGCTFTFSPACFSCFISLQLITCLSTTNVLFRLFYCMKSPICIFLPFNCCHIFWFHNYPSLLYTFVL